jgi:hypothetical protein
MYIVLYIEENRPGSQVKPEQKKQAETLMHIFHVNKAGKKFKNYLGIFLKIYMFYVWC